MKGQKCIEQVWRVVLAQVDRLKVEGFRDKSCAITLRAFELADEVAVLVYRMTAGFPKEELYDLTSQMRRASVAVSSNIVEAIT